MATYYVDATLGLDGNAGTSELVPWKTLDKADNGPYNAGDSIRLKKGEEWHESFVHPSTGLIGSQIILTSYGSGDKPIVSGAVLPTWVSEGSNYYYVEIAGNDCLGGVWDSKARMTLAASKIALNTTTEYWIDTVPVPDRLYVWDDSGTPTTIEYSSLDNVISITDLSYITISEIEVFGSIGSLILVDGATGQRYGIIIDDCTIHGFYRYGIENPANNPVDLVIRNHTIYDGTEGIDYGAGIYAGAGNVVTIESNNLYDVDHGIWTKNVYDSGIIRYNLIYDTWDDGIFAEDTCEIYYNICWNNADDGIELGVNADASTIYNNTIGEASDCGIALSVGCINCVVKNNIIYNCMRSDGENDQLRDMYVATGTGHDIDYNLYYSDGTFLWYWEAEYTTFAAWKTASGQDGNSPNPIDPQLDDYELEAHSPCINAGEELGFIRDYIGNVVPQGSAPDIGAYEYLVYVRPECVTNPWMGEE